MIYNFDKIVERRGTGSMKHDGIRVLAVDYRLGTQFVWF